MATYRTAEKQKNHESRDMNIPQLWNTRWKKFLWLMFFIMALVTALLMGWLRYVFNPWLFNPWLPPQIQFSKPTLKPVVGDFGGVPVTIPPKVAELVEFDGDPGWGEKREGPVPQRTHMSKISSFGVDFRYPDMATLSSPEMWADKNSKSIYNTDWMHFGVESGSRGPVTNGYLDKIVKRRLKDGVALHYVYVQQPQSAYGMTWYLLVEKGSGKPVDPMNSPTVAGESLYIGRNAQGEVIAAIECSTVRHTAAPCDHRFSMQPDGMNASIYIGYRRPQLEHWRDIQNKVRTLILSFKAPGVGASAATSPADARPVP